MKQFSLILAVLIALSATEQTANATSISFTSSNLGGMRWQNTYTVNNDSLPSELNAFTIYFDYNLYANLDIPSLVSGWDLLTTQPDVTLGDGWFDAAATTNNSGIIIGGELSGFTVTFDWLGNGTPGVQSYDIFDPSNYETPLESGYTTYSPISPAPVPEPSTVALFAVGLAGLAGTKANRKK